MQNWPEYVNLGKIIRKLIISQSGKKGVQSKTRYTSVNN